MDSLKIFIAYIFLISSANILCQNKKSYLEFSLGISKISFTDFSTSPLTYSGNPFLVSLEHTDISNKRQSSIRFSGAFGNFINDFNNQTSTSSFAAYEISYVELYHLDFLSSNKTHTKIGGHFNGLAIQRNNPSLLNSSKGIDVFANLFGTIQTSFKFKNKSGDYNSLLFQIDIGTVNTSYRNGFTNVNQSSVLNDENFFEGYQLNFFDDSRFKANISYVWQLQSKNGLELSYNYEILKTNQIAHNFRMRSHQLRFVFHFLLKSS